MALSGSLVSSEPEHVGFFTPLLRLSLKCDIGMPEDRIKHCSSKVKIGGVKFPPS